MTGTVRYNVALLEADMKGRGWEARDLARAAGVNDARVSRFLNGHSQTARTLKLLAKALRRKPGRYIIPSSEVAA